MICSAPLIIIIVMLQSGPSLGQEGLVRSEHSQLNIASQAIYY